MGAAQRPASGACAAAAGALLALCLALALASPAAASGPVPGAALPRLLLARDEALEHLASQRGGGYPPSLAPYVLEAAAASGADGGSFGGGAGVRSDVPLPAGEGPLLPRLRALRALALDARLAGGPTDEGEVIRQVLAGHRDGQFGDPALLNDDMFALLALDAAGALPEPSSGTSPSPEVAEAVASSARALRDAGDAGWGWSATGAAETDTTGMALAALRAAARVAPDAWPSQARLSDVEAFLREAQRPGGGFGLTPRGAANCESTAWGIRALAALHPDPSGPGGAGGDAAVAAWLALLALQDAEGGWSHVAGARPDLLCTAEAATLLGDALAGRVAVPPALADAVASPGDGGPAKGSPGAGAGLAAVAAGLAAAWAERRRRHGSASVPGRRDTRRP